MSEPVLEAHAISVRRGSSQILDNVSLSVVSDAQLLVRGPSGSGKTTLFNILGLLSTPTSGSICVSGTEASTLKRTQRARIRRDTIGFIFQDFQLVPDLTAFENAALPQDHTGERDEEWLETLFEELAISHLTTQYPGTLSGGEKQRVAIARALANRPDVLLADEPTGQLDPKTTSRVLEFLLRLHESTDTALVTISHDPSLEREFDRTVYLENGSLYDDVPSNSRELHAQPL